MSTLIDKRFIIVVGKGGVGKSTVCAALGLAAARRGRRTIIAELNTREKATRFFGVPEAGYGQRKLAENLYSTNIQPGPALHEYGLRKLKFEWIFKRVFGNGAVQTMLKMLPGMNELLLLGKAFDLERDRDASGELLWDTVIIDAPATGHGISLLRLPDTLIKIAGAGAMAEDLHLMRALLTDPERTVVHLVTLAEEMPVRETFELAGQVDSTLQMTKGALIVNAIWPEALSPADAERLVDAKVDAPAVVADAIACAEAMSARRTMQDRYLIELEALNLPTHLVSYQFVGDFNADAIAAISDALVPSEGTAP